ncbi:MAG TPA: ABC transporter permease [Rhodanobacteraceae bacterium]|nr:ABC transporter permease [Rhodanobacteraceae bacterium]
MKKFLLNLGLLLLIAVVLAMWVKLPWQGALVLLGLLVLWMGLTRSGRQAGSVTAVGASTLRQRLGSSSVIVFGIAGVVGVLIAMLAMGAGLQKTMQSGGSDDTAIVMRGGAPTESQSVLVRADLDAIAQAPGVVRNADGKPLISGEVVVAANVQRKDSGEDASVQIRGVDDTAWAVRPGIKIIEGRSFKTGMRELVVGQNAARQYAHLQPGQSIKLGADTWQVVGVFASGDGYDSELWGDRTTVSSVYRRGNSVSAALVKLTDDKAFDGFKAALSSDPKLNVRVETTKDYLAQQSEGLVKVIRSVGITVGVIMAIGAIFGALNCMFAAVTSRSREIATLRAIGFRGLPVVVSVMLETMLLALLGGLLGAAIVWLLFNGHSASTLNGFTQVLFTFDVNRALIWTGLKWALAIGFIGGLFPAVRAARLPVTTALRES